MMTCIICKFPVEEDDVAIHGGSPARVVCTGCYHRAIQDEHPMPRRLRRELTAYLLTLSEAWMDK